ncbi:MAG: methionyl-tRNA formyltransferase [Bacteroidales bacterium]|nr:methionyl-tRNA formyltransferase [Bacteroidales bacterium]
MRIVFMGTPDFAVASLDAIVKAGFEVAGVVTVPDRQTGRGLKMTGSPVKQYALEHHLLLLQPEKLRNEHFLEQLRNLNADLFVVVAFRMLPVAVWSMPPLGTFNLHASLLPNYRGAAPINWALINGETETGVTTFLLNERIDEGEILLQEKTPIADNDNAGSLHDRLATIGSKVVVKTIEGLASGLLKPQAQPQTANPLPAPKIFKEDCAIHWDWSGERIVNFVRGLSPYPAATMQMTDAKGKEHQIKVFDVRFEPSPKVNNDEPFSIKTLQNKRLFFSVSSGFIEILSLQLNGKKRNNAEEFLRGHDVMNWNLII